tara:strand:- start:547 stop:1227 length:681 start_codon:yes stop_codon:yes gene_type:complete
MGSRLGSAPSVPNVVKETEEEFGFADSMNMEMGETMMLGNGIGGEEQEHKVGVEDDHHHFSGRYFVSEMAGVRPVVVENENENEFEEATITTRDNENEEATITTRDNDEIGSGVFLDGGLVDNSANPWIDSEVQGGGGGSRPVTAPSGLEFNLDGGTWEVKGGEKNKKVTMTSFNGGEEKILQEENIKMKMELMQKDAQVKLMMDELFRLRQLTGSYAGSVSELSA